MTVASAKAIRDLEFDRLKELVSGYTQSSLGREAIAGLEPIADRAALEEEIAAVREATAFISRALRLPLGGVEDLRPLLERAREGTHLDGEEWGTILSTIEAAARVRAALGAADDLPRLQRLARQLADHSRLATRIYRTVDEAGEVRDDASPLLARLTAKRRAVEERIARRLREFMARNPELIGEAVITRRGGRLVIPVKSGAIGAAEFVVHDRSATGQTLYAEPTSIVPENNTAAQLEAEIHQERVRLLRELTATFLGEARRFLRDREVLARIDSLFARARYGVENRCAFPRFSGEIRLLDARHPLIPPDRVVPISASLGGKTRVMVITGPNTGGKTVTLRTIGLLTLMAQSGIPIPASPDSELALVSRVRTDIGDEQSLEQNLSTFSAHMKNIVSILDEVDSDSLVLLDELGAGTDPQEGAALGLAILERLLEVEALVVVSTHLTPLKYFAIRHPRVKTASMEFDPESLAPTFHLIEGIPGRSNAFIIARNLGLDAALVARAREFLAKGEIKAEDIIEQLQREQRSLADYRRRAAAELANAQRLREEFEGRLAAFEARKEEEIARNLKELGSFLREAQQEAERLLAAARAEESRAAMRNAHRRITELRAELESRAGRAEDAGKEHRFARGDSVRIRPLDARGTIVELDGGRATVDVDGKRFRTKISDLEPAPPALPSRPPRERISRPAAPSRVSLQLNVRGMTVAAALAELERYLDRLLLADVRRASVLHGKGTGALRDAIRSYLSSCSFVKSVGPAPPREGGDGVTVFELGK